MEAWLLVTQPPSVKEKKIMAHLRLVSMVLSAAAYSLFAASGACAQGSASGRASSADSEMLLAGEQTVITVSKKAQKASDAPAAVTVITEEQIRDYGASTLLDILRYAAGVDVFEQNHAAANVSIRGLNTQYANKLLVMIDGRSIYEDFLGTVFWQTNPLLISRIKRIEIVRGPGAALYGANAFNGVINIITKTPAELADSSQNLTTRLLTGERNSQFLEAQATGGSAKNVSFSVGAAYNHVDGFDGRKTDNVPDGYSTSIVTLDAEKRTPRGSLRLAAGSNETSSDQVEILRLPATHGHNSFASLTYAEDRGKSPLLARVFYNSTVQNADGVRYGDTGTLDAEVQQSRALSARNSLTYGGSFRHVETFSNITGTNIHAQNLWALYAQDEWQLAKRTRLFTGLRLDDNSLYGANVSPRISLVHHLPAAQTLRATFGTAFRAPTLEDSYVDLMIPVAPQTNLHAVSSAGLKPEYLLNYEFGYRKELPHGYMGASLYYNRVTGLIGSRATAFFPSPPYPPNTASESETINVGNAQVYGLELEAQTRLGRHLRALANYAYEDQRAPASRSQPYLAPKHKVNMALDYAVSSRCNAFLGTHFVGAATTTISQAAATAPAYLRVDARLAYRFGSVRHPWNVAVSALNLFDDRHKEYPDVAQPSTVTAQRRTAFLSLQGSF